MTSDGGAGGRVLQITLPWRERCDAWGPTIIFNVVVDAVFRHWDSLVVERGVGGGSSNDNNKAAHPEGKTIWARDDGLLRVE